MTAAATEAITGRPRKYGNEETDSLSLRLPMSALSYLGPDKTRQREAGIAALFFEKDLSAELADVLAELRINAAQHGQSYDLDRAETIARLVRQGLKAEKTKR